MKEKQELRRELRARRRAHVDTLPDVTRALLFMRPPGPLLEMIGDAQSIGLYHAQPAEAPTAAYGRFFFERGATLALPFFASRDAAMEFRAFTDPFEESDLEPGPFGPQQAAAGAATVDPEILFVPLVGFTAQGRRLGQGGGHYDRYLSEHDGVKAIGLAWDCQEVERIPNEDHDRALHAVITPTRILGPF